MDWLAFEDSKAPDAEPAVLGFQYCGSLPFVTVLIADLARSYMTYLRRHMARDIRDFRIWFISRKHEHFVLLKEVGERNILWRKTVYVPNWPTVDDFLPKDGDGGSWN
jgi:hypothetical protein